MSDKEGERVVCVCVCVCVCVRVCVRACVCVSDLQLGEHSGDLLQDGVHAVSHGHGVFPVVVRDPAVVLPH